VEEYNVPADYTTQKGILFVAYGNTREEFDAYRESFSCYTFSGTDTDDSGNVEYLYAAKDGSYFVTLSYSESEGRYAVLVYAYRTVKGGTQGSGNGIPYDELITNEGAGLPSDPDGVYDVDFTKGEYIKDVTNQSLYVDGCSPTGSPGVLVIPVQFSDATAESKGFSIKNIVEAFSKDGKTDYYSLYDYYYISSYGQLTLDITVLDFWFTPEHDSEYYSTFSFTFEGEELSRGEQLILNEALDYLDDSMDLSQFDSDGNGTIDSVILVNTLDVDYSLGMFYWAFCYYNFYKDGSGSFYEYDGVYVKNYTWAPYLFLHEVRNEQGYSNYDDVTVMNTRTFIHEFGHMLGLDDYYSYTGIDFPLHGCDIMDSRVGDHNAFSKFNLGWLTTSRLVVADGSITLTLEDFSKNGDTIIIANNWDDKLGAYQEYYVLLYYTHNGLNVGGDKGYFDTEGILVYHVNAAMYMQEGKDLYDVYNKNTDVSHENGTENNLIEYVLSSDGTCIYGVGDTPSTVTDDYGNELVYSFTVDALTSEYATITFYAK
jgi:M6 family metalloprotease-like protein